MSPSHFETRMTTSEQIEPRRAINPEYISSELCRFCEEEDETFAQLLNECPCFNTYRREILKKIPEIKKKVSMKLWP